MKTVLAIAAFAAMTGAAAAADVGGVAESDSVWTGFYAGVQAGYAWGDASVTDTNGGVAPGPFDYDAEGGFGGATFGYNHQFGAFVAGVEAELGYLDLEGDGRIPSSNPGQFQAIFLEGGFYAVVAGRVGYAFDNTLLYAKGGYAYFDGEASQQTTSPGFVTNPGEEFSGWAVGGGIEHMLTDRISVKLEYLHFDFGSVDGNQTSVADIPIGFVYTNETDLEADSIKAGINFQF